MSSKYRRYERVPKELPWDIHPAWRGIGCLLIFLLPLISFAISDLLVERYYELIPIPTELSGSLDTVVFGVVDFFFAKLGLAVVLTFVIFAVLSIFYSILYRVTGPSRYGPMDVPPEEMRRYRRR